MLEKIVLWVQINRLAVLVFSTLVLVNQGPYIWQTYQLFRSDMIENAIVSTVIVTVAVIAAGMVILYNTTTKKTR